MGSTLDSLLAQTMTRWHAVVVDDGANEATASIVDRFAALDPRISLARAEVLGQPPTNAAAILCGASGWLLMLDAGDRLRPAMLERMRDAFEADATLDAVHCGWAFTDARGRVLAERSCKATGNLFDQLARHLAFPSAACVARRTVLEAAGGSIPARTDVDAWLLWQRIARRGARFGRVAEVLVDLGSPAVLSAAERVASLDAGVQAIARGHGVDPDAGLAPDDPYYAGRLLSADLAVFSLVCRIAGELLGAGDDAGALIERMPTRPLDDVVDAAAGIIESAAVSAGRTHAERGELWMELRPRLEPFLAAMQVRLNRPGLARVMVAEIQRLVLPYLSSPLPYAVAGSHTVRLEVTEPIGDVELPPDAEVLQLLVVLEGETLGALEIAASDGRVSASEIRRAVADAHAWRILGRFFERTAYDDLLMRRERGGWSAWRGTTCVARELPDGDESERLAALHDAIGRTTIEDQLWAPDPPIVARAMVAIDRLAASIRGSDDGRRRGMPRPTVVEAGIRVPWLTFSGRNVAEQLRVAGVPVAAAEIVVGTAGVLTARALRAAVVDAAGDLLTRVVVRELLLGAPFQRGVTLRDLIGQWAERRGEP